jgi:hypothetical protein
MTINDLELCDHFRKLYMNFSQIDRLTRDGQEHQLFMALSEIELAAREAQARLNKMNLRWPNA